MQIKCMAGLACPQALSPMCRSRLFTKKATKTTLKKLSKRWPLHDGDAMYVQPKSIEMFTGTLWMPVHVVTDIRAKLTVLRTGLATRGWQGGEDLRTPKHKGCRNIFE